MGQIKYMIFVGLACLCLGIGIGWFMQRNGYKIGELTINSGQNKIALKVEQEKVEHAVLMKSLFSSDWTVDAAKGWLKRNQDMFHFRDVTLSDKIKMLDTKDDISKNLRELSRQKLGPWAYDIDTIKIGYPENAPRGGRAYGCENKKYYRQKVKLISLNGKNEVVVEVTGKYQCPDGLHFPDLQISRSDKEKLFGKTPFSETETVMALILND